MAIGWCVVFHASQRFLRIRNDPPYLVVVYEEVKSEKCIIKK
jgi:hypothetical protein